MKRISGAVIRRLPRYYRQLKEMEREGIQRTSSLALGKRMGLTASQIRQDFNNFGGFGQQGFGYKVSELRAELAGILGVGEGLCYRFVIIGAGNMGRALGRYSPFSQEGYQLMGVFDNTPERIGQNIEGVPVMPMEQLVEFVRQNDIDIAVLTVPAAAAQKVADTLAQTGIRGIWNFAPVDLVVPETITVESIHLTDSLMTLTYRLRQQSEETGDAEPGAPRPVNKKS